MIAGETSRAYQATFTINLVRPHSSIHPLAFHVTFYPSTVLSSPHPHLSLSSLPLPLQVTCRAVGIGAYLVRLGQRVVQVDNSHIILTGATALNKVLGREVGVCVCGVCVCTCVCAIIFYINRFLVPMPTTPLTPTGVQQQCPTGWSPDNVLQWSQSPHGSLRL